MSRSGMAYRCRECGYQAPQWLGRCPQCGEWASLAALDADAPPTEESPPAKPRTLASLPEASGARRPTQIAEFDRVLGGGILAGSTVLIGGEPGVGKSTLMLQAAERLAACDPDTNRPWLYVSGEEAPPQIKLRAERLGMAEDAQLAVLGEQRLSAIREAVREIDAAGLVVDSVQTIQADGGPERAAPPGSPPQVGEVAFALSRLAAERSIPVVLIGHVTKAGEFAGPKAIEHLVDAALYLEGGPEGETRLLRAVKNRYGSTEEIGLFQMGEQGLAEIADPSRFFASRSGQVKPGSVIVPSLEGSRPILVEIQALVVGSRASVPQRRASGLDPNRVAMLLAVIEKRLGLQIGRDDVYLNVAGGMALRETAVDVGIAAAVVSSYRNRAIDADTVVWGELGLSGELRRVRRFKDRLKEASKLGFRQAIVPPGPDEAALASDLEVTPATGVEEVIDQLGL